MSILNRKDGQDDTSEDRTADRKLAPRTVEEQDAPEPERPTRPDEEADMAVHQLDDPPQAEGER
jgi:hypothetical protein